MTGSAADWQLRATPPFVSGSLGAAASASLRDAGCLSASQPTPNPLLLGHLHPPSRRPPPSVPTPELRPEPRAAGDRGGGGGGFFFFFFYFFFGGLRIALPEALTGEDAAPTVECSSRETERRPAQREEAGGCKGRSPHVPVAPPSRGARVRPAEPPLPRRAARPALAGWFREGVRAAGLSMEAAAATSSCDPAGEKTGLRISASE